MDQDDDSYRSGAEFLGDVTNQALRDPAADNPDEPRDPAWLRWMKFAAIIGFLAMLFGLVWFGVEFVSAYNGTRVNLSAATQNTREDMFPQACRHSLIAAALGGGLGLLYVVKCILKRVDP